MTEPNQAAPEALPTVDSILQMHQGSGAPGLASPEAPAEAGPEPSAEAAPPPSPPEESAELPTEPPQAAPSDTDRLLALMEQERQLRSQQDTVRETQAKLESDRKALETRAGQLEKYRKLEEVILRKDAGALLDLLEISEDQLLDSLRQGSGADPLREIRSEMRGELDKYKSELEALKAEQQQKERTQLQEQTWQEIRTGLDEHSPALAALARLNPQVIDGVYDTMRAHYRETREVPSLQQVTPGLEREALEQAAAITEALLPYLPDTAKEKLRAALAAPGDAAAQGVTKTEAGVKPTRSLTNEATAGSVEIPPKDLDLTFDRDADIDRILAKHGIR